MGDSLKEAILAAKRLLLEDEEFKVKLKDVTTITGVGDFLRGFVPLWWIMKKVVAAVEIIYVEYHQITEAERIDVASELLDDLITFSGWLTPLEIFDGMLFKALISAAVQALNDKFGHNWFANISGDKKELLTVIG